VRADCASPDRCCTVTRPTPSPTSDSCLKKKKKEMQAHLAPIRGLAPGHKRWPSTQDAPPACVGCLRELRGVPPPKWPEAGCVSNFLPPGALPGLPARLGQPRGGPAIDRIPNPGSPWASACTIAPVSNKGQARCIPEYFLRTLTNARFLSLFVKGEIALAARIPEARVSESSDRSWHHSRLVDGC